MRYATTLRVATVFVISGRSLQVCYGPSGPSGAAGRRGHPQLATVAPS
jgi:hypothetical protein